MNAPDVASLTFDERGLIGAVAQDAATGTVLMVAYMDHDALARTVASGEAHFWSRSRQAPWHKGATSGNVLHVEDIQACLLYTSPSPRDLSTSRMPSSA